MKYCMRFGIGLLAVVFCASSATANWNLEPQTLSRIPAGTTFADRTPPPGWSNLVLFVEGRLASGDVSAASATVKSYAKKFNLVMMANAAKDSDGKYYLEKVGIGFSIKVDGKNMVVSSDEGKTADLSFIGKQVLAGNEDALKDITQTARNETSMIIDAPTVILRDGKHVKMMVRYVIWVAPASGNIGTVCWLMENTRSDYNIAEDTFQFLPPNYVEDRIMNVDGNQFNFLGMPTPEAFALVKIPQGKAYKFTPALESAAGYKTLSKDQYTELLKGMATALSQR
jgi:hypothetical protein